MMVNMLIDTATNSDFIREAILNFSGGNFDAPTDTQGTTMLILAVRSERISVVELLLLKGADVNKQD